MSNPAAYSRAQIALHWVIAAIVAYQILFSEGIEGLWRDRMRGTIPNEASVSPHAIAGLLILVLMIWRVALRLRRGAPPSPPGEHPAMAMASKATHGLFYLLLIAMPMSGAVAWFGGFELPAELHGAASNLLILLIVVHVAAAIAHQFWWKTDVLRRMMRPG